MPPQTQQALQNTQKTMECSAVCNMLIFLYKLLCTQILNLMERVLFKYFSHILY